MFRRSRRPIPPRYVVTNTTAIDGVARANQMMANGQPQQAAELFMQLAREMQEAGRPRQAANMHTQAAHAWLDAGTQERALNQTSLALRLFASQGMWERARHFKVNFIAHLRRNGEESASTSVEGEYNALTKTAGINPQVAARAVINRGSLPAICPHCGALLRSDTVEWIDAVSAECGFCGGTVVTSKPESA